MPVTTSLPNQWPCPSSPPQNPRSLPSFPLLFPLPPYILHPLLSCTSTPLPPPTLYTPLPFSTSPPSPISATMRMSCNGCRVLRKGCTDNCSIRPCLQWIRSPESQANATVFLAKFYGRAGLLNLINAAPGHLQPAVFRSLLYEACGRIVNPIYGSVGLLWSGSWQLCQAAVEAVLKGEPIVPVPSDSPANCSPPLKAYDIRHIAKRAAVPEIHKVKKSRCRFKRCGAKPRIAAEAAAGYDSGHGCYPSGFRRASSHESSVSHQSEARADGRDRSASVVSGVASPVSSGEAAATASDESDVELELTLGLEPHVNRSSSSLPSSETRTRETKASLLDFPA